MNPKAGKVSMFSYGVAVAGMFLAYGLTIYGFMKAGENWMAFFALFPPFDLVLSFWVDKMLGIFTIASFALFVATVWFGDRK